MEETTTVMIGKAAHKKAKTLSHFEEKPIREVVEDGIRHSLVKSKKVPAAIKAELND